MNILKLYFINDKYLTFDAIKNGNPTNITYDQKTDKNTIALSKKPTILDSRFFDCLFFASYLL